jgi:hypothetical protein
MKHLDQTRSRDLLDEMVRLSNAFAWREIRRLRARLQDQQKEGMKLWAKWGCYRSGVELPHDIGDFLQSLGE